MHSGHHGLLCNSSYFVVGLMGLMQVAGMQVMVDFHACRWPSSIPTSHDTSIAEYFDNLNEPALSNLAENLEMEEEESGSRSPLITFSHFLPLQVRI